MTIQQLVRLLAHVCRSRPMLCRQELRHLAGWLPGDQCLSISVTPGLTPPDGAAAMEATFRTSSGVTRSEKLYEHPRDISWLLRTASRSSAASSTPLPDNGMSLSGSDLETIHMLHLLLQSMAEQLLVPMWQNGEPESKASCLVDIWPALQHFSALPPKAPMDQQLKSTFNLLSVASTCIEKLIPPSAFDRTDTGPRPNGC